MVNVNRSTGTHDVTVDAQYVDKLRNYTYDGDKLVRSKRRSTSSSHELAPDAPPPPEDGERRRRKRSPSVSHNASEPLPPLTSREDVTTTPYDNKTVKYIQARGGSDHVLHIAITNNQTFLAVQNLRNRLIIDLPHGHHELKVRHCFAAWSS